MNFIKKRIITSILAFFAVINLDFIIPRLVPGNAALILAAGSMLAPAQVAALTKRFGLDKPITDQYVIYLQGIFTHWPPDFGNSYQYWPQPVTTLISQRLPWTLLLIVTSIILASSISFFLAGYSSVRRGGKLELASVYSSIFLWAIPAFWVGMILIWVFAVSLGWLPVFGNLGFNNGTGLKYALAVLSHAILPIITLVLTIFGVNYILLRGASQQVLQSDYVLAAKIRGIKSRVIAFGYIVRNSLLPLVSLLGFSMASIISAVIPIESVFGYSGVGDLFLDGITHRDIPVLEASFFYLTIVVIAFALIGDLLLLQLDPRLR
jgi:peptide/nickel transport system permease protein